MKFMIFYKVKWLLQSIYQYIYPYYQNNICSLYYMLSIIYYNSKISQIALFTFIQICTLDNLRFVSRMILLNFIVSSSKIVVCYVFQYLLKIDK